jgi:hypothetical protein
MEYVLTNNTLTLCDLGAKPISDLFMISYLNDLHHLFLRRLEEMKNQPRRLTAPEEKELRFMVEELIRAKNSSIEAE